MYRILIIMLSLCSGLFCNKIGAGTHLGRQSWGLGSRDPQSLGRG